MASAASMAKKNPGKFQAITDLENVWKSSYGQLPTWEKPNPLADVTDPETGGRKTPKTAIDPMYLYGIGALILVLLLKRRKR